MTELLGDHWLGKQQGAHQSQQGRRVAGPQQLQENQGRIGTYFSYTKFTLRAQKDKEKPNNYF